jgi:hypothetical protein
MSGQYSADSVQYGSSIDQEGNRAGLIIQFADIWTMVEDIVNLPVFVTILSENVLQEHQLYMQAVLITESYAPVSKAQPFVGLVVMGPSVEIEIHMGGFAVNSVAQRAIGTSENICVQEGRVALTFDFYGELNALMDAV